MPGDFVLDPFFGGGTVGLVCRRLGRQFVGIELNPHYLNQAMESLRKPPPAARRSGRPLGDGFTARALRCRPVAKKVETA